MKLLFALLVTAIPAGCMTSHVMIGQARTPTTPDQVKLYASPPAHYEEIALIESSSKATWAITEQGKTDATINRMKKDAAELSANGILITGMGEGASEEGDSGSVMQGYSANGTYGTGVATNVQYKTGQAIAIWVGGD